MPCTSVTPGTRESHNASLHSEPLSPCSGFATGVTTDPWKNACVCSYAHLLVAQVLGARGGWGPCLAHLWHGSSAPPRPSPLPPAGSRNPSFPARPTPHLLTGGRGWSGPRSFPTSAESPWSWGLAQPCPLTRSPLVATPCRRGWASSRPVSAPCLHRCLHGGRTIIHFSSVSDEGGRSRYPSPSRAHLAPGAGPGSPPAGAPWVQEAARVLENHLQTWEEPAACCQLSLSRCSPCPRGKDSSVSGAVLRASGVQGEH